MDYCVLNISKELVHRNVRAREFLNYIVQHGAIPEFIFTETAICEVRRGKQSRRGVRKRGDCFKGRR